MNVDRAGTVGGGAAISNGPDQLTRVVPLKEAQGFSAAVGGGKEQGLSASASGLEETDMGALLRDSIRGSLAATARQIQQNAKDIERDNIDKGF
ncbi:MAG: hypothetical protein LBV80_05980 [Deltaproteobacteria bacterium]|jgi:hypothetical protein|nr:hypothetical protein [Deltaproteobacteria bacterium]